MTRTIGKTVFAAFLGVSLLAAGACTRTERYAATGGAIGAGTGAVVAGATGGNVLAGAAVGGAVGAVGGAVVSKTRR
jgi:osmotically inducible lipoprotein OsmB